MTVLTKDDSSTGDVSNARQAPIVGDRTARSMIVVFVLLIAVPPIHQTIADFQERGRWRFLSLFDSFPTHDSLKQFEESLARDSALGTRARLYYKEHLMRWLGQGNEKVVVGRDGFLFYVDEIEMATGPGFLDRRLRASRGDGSPASASTDATAAIVDFDRQLRDSGIHLVFVPLPVKPILYPDRVWAGYPLQDGPAWNRDRDAFLDRLTRAGVDVLDVTDALWAARAVPGEDLFLKLDTHWTPRGVAVVADRIAAHVDSRLRGAERISLTTRTQRVTNFGDMLRVLEIEPDSGLFTSQSVDVVQVLAGEKFVSGDDSSPVLLLGDSFTNIYRRREMGWGEGAGLGEQLMLRLGLGIQVIAINGGGATAVRESLAMKPAALDRKRVVIWACTARDLHDRSIAWEHVPIPRRAVRSAAPVGSAGVSP